MNIKITSKNVLAHELIGLKIKIRRNKSEVTGTIINETKNTLEILTGKKKLKLPKMGSKIELYLEEENVLIDGNTIAFRPWERTKKLIGKKGMVLK